MTEEELADYQAKRGKDTFQQLIESKGFNPTEDVEHLAVARYLNLLGVLWVHCPNEGKRSKAAGGRLKAMGMKAGFPDFLILDAPPYNHTCKGVAIELKRQKGGKVSDEQRQWLDDLRHRGWMAEVMEGANDAITWLRSLGWRIGGPLPCVAKDDCPRDDCAAGPNVACPYYEPNQEGV